MKWELEEEETSDGPAWSVYDEHGDRLTAPYIRHLDACLIAKAPELLKLAMKVDALFKCGDGLLRAEGGCNKLLGEILDLVPGKIVAEATDYSTKGRDGA